MLLLAFSITDPDGMTRDETVHILSRHFDTKEHCITFVQDWSGTIQDRGLETVQGMLAEGWRVSLSEIGCSVNPATSIETISVVKFQPEEEQDAPEPSE
ncbi:uncharacterized protein METZ01_LOCUS263316 [marine metagenome]|uniref:Uncharacterized protein n=1 Tax=marine metagenome TaxID=408172 RepID=A0A382JGI7_9ZZZZ